MSVIRGTSLAHYPELVSELGADPAELLRRAGVPSEVVGRRDAFLTYRAMIAAVESAATATGVSDFGRRLGQRQGIEILGPVGVAAGTAGTVADAFTIFESYIAAYSPAISARLITDPDRSTRSRFEFAILIADPPPCAQTVEMSLGVALRVLRFLISPDWHPVAVHVPHEPLTPLPEYVAYFGADVHPADRFAGFTILTTDLARRLNRDDVTHQALVDYLDTVVTDRSDGMTGSVRQLTRQLLPTGAASLDVVAAQFLLHPKGLQRRLRNEGTTFAEIVDHVRRDTVERYLRDTDLTMSHLAREVGYAEQSVLTRSCHRWFGEAPQAHRLALRIR